MSNLKPGEDLSIPDERQRQWFSDEVHPHEGSLRAYIRGSFPSLFDVDDVVQEAYLRILKVSDSTSIHSAKGLLYRVARHLAIDQVRRQKRSPVVAIADVQTIPETGGECNAVELTCTEEELAILAEALDKLPSRCREILILRRLQGVPQKEIAARLGISEQTVQAQVQRGVKGCAKILFRRGLRGTL